MTTDSGAGAGIVTRVEPALRRVSLLRTWLLVASVAVGVVASSGAAFGEEANESTPPVNAEHPSGYERLRSFGGPTSVGSQLRADHTLRRGHRLNLFARELGRYHAFKKRLKQRHGLSFGLDYNLFYQHATARLPGGPDDAAGGVFRFYGGLALVGRNTDCEGSLVWKVENRSALGTDLSPNGLGLAVGSLLPSATTFSDWGWGVTNLQWQQHLRFGQVRAGFALGQVDVTDWLDVNMLANPWTGFANMVSFQYATNPAPDQGLGAMAFAVFRERNTPYVLAGVSDANGEPTRAGFDTFFDVGEHYTYAELGWTPSYARRYDDNVHVSFWHQDARMAAGTRESWGLSAAATWKFCDRWTPFVRAGYSEGGAAFAEASAALGCGYALRNHDLLGFAASWARPSDSASRDQYTLQFFYNLALGEHLHLTPDLQVVIDPSLNPSEDVIAFLGLRLRVDF